MRLQLLSDLHMETEVFEPVPAPAAELLILAGDIDSSWAALRRFAGWPVPVIFVAGNHEFDRRDVRGAWDGLRRLCADAGIRMLEQEEALLTGADGRRIRFVATTRWCDFDLLGPPQRGRCMRASRYFVEIMRAQIDGKVFDAVAVREQALACRAWLAQALRTPPVEPVDATVVITHYGPSSRSADPRYGLQAGTASFCNDDEDLLPLADLWLHGHLHCRHDYQVLHDSSAARASTRVVSNARGHSFKGEAEGHDPLRVVEI